MMDNTTLRHIENLFYTYFQKYSVTYSYVEDLEDSVLYVCKADIPLQILQKCSLHFRKHGLVISKFYKIKDFIHFIFSLQIKSSRKRSRRSRNKRRQNNQSDSFIYLVEKVDCGMFWTLQYHDDVVPVKIFFKDEDCTRKFTGSSRLTKYAYWYLTHHCAGEITCTRYKQDQKNKRIQEDFKQHANASPFVQLQFGSIKKNRLGLGLHSPIQFQQGPVQQHISDKGLEIYNKIKERSSQTIVKSDPPESKIKASGPFTLESGCMVGYDYAKASIQNELSDPTVMRAAVVYAMLRSDRYKISPPFDEYSYGCFLKSKGIPLDNIPKLINDVVGSQWRARVGDPRSSSPPFEQMVKTYEQIYKRH